MTFVTSDQQLKGSKKICHTYLARRVLVMLVITITLKGTHLC